MIHGTSTAADKSAKAAVQEAMRVLQQFHSMKTIIRRWVCEVCGMLHSGPAPKACDSCGVVGALVAQSDFNMEMGSRR